MSQGWRVALVFVGTIGAAAIIFQLNQGTLATSFFSTVTSAIGEAFSKNGSNSSGSTSKSNTNKTGSNQHFTLV